LAGAGRDGTYLEDDVDIDLVGIGEAEEGRGRRLAGFEVEDRSLHRWVLVCQMNREYTSSTMSSCGLIDSRRPSRRTYERQVPQDVLNLLPRCPTSLLELLDRSSTSRTIQLTSVRTPHKGHDSSKARERTHTISVH
jgi:hypothetical protein